MHKEVMPLIDLMGFAAFLTNVLGNFLLARKDRRGWPVRIVSILLWGTYAWNITSWPMVANAVTFLFINAYGWHHWGKEQRRSNG